MTEQQMGGTAPEPEDQTSATDQASEQTVGTVAVADEPASTAETSEPTETSSSTLSQAVDPATTETAEGRNGVAPAEALEGAPSADVAPIAPFDGSTESERATAAPAADSEQGAESQPAAESEQGAESQPAADSGPLPESESAAEFAQPEPAVAVSEASDAPAAQASEGPAPRPVPTGPEPATMEELLAEQDSDIKSFKHGDVVEGNVVRIDKDEILVDIGAKSEGVVSNRELYGRHAEQQPQLNVGDVVLVYVLQPESQEGHVVLSLRRAGLERKWRAMQEQFEAGVIIEAPVIDHNKGGLIVDCGIRGFVPISQIVDFPRRPQNDQPRDAAQEIAEKLQPFVGRKLRLKILEVNRKANRLILSEKVALYEERREKRDELFSSLQVGQKVTGTVRSIAPFGVFIDLGGIDGLVHKSELSWNKVNNPESGYKVGEEVEAEVIDINHERGRISLSIRRLQPDPWHSTVADYRVGDVIDGTVTKLVNFGAFVRVRDGLEGLIHISELSHQRVAHPGDVVHEGQALKLKIISLDSERHRLGLSLKQAEEAPARPTPPEPTARAERKPRGDRERERGYSMADAVQEPEGGIDNTLAAAFAQVRQQVAESERETAGDEGDGAAAEAVVETAPTTADADQPEATVEAEPATAEAEPGTADVPEATAEAEPATAEAEPATADVPEATAEAEPGTADVPEATAEAEPGTADVPEATAEAEVAVATAEAEPATAEAEPGIAGVPEATADAEPATTERDVPETSAEAVPTSPETEATGEAESAATADDVAPPDEETAIVAEESEAAPEDTQKKAKPYADS